MSVEYTHSLTEIPPFWLYCMLLFAFILSKKFHFQKFINFMSTRFFIHNFCTYYDILYVFYNAQWVSLWGGTQDVMPDFLMTLVQLHMRLVAVPP